MNHDIAVVGMAARLPDAATAAQFWRNLVGGVESARPLTDAQLLAAGVAPRQFADLRYVKSAVVLDGFDQFDAEFFGFSPKEAAVMDPQHRQFLECAWEALEDAAHAPQTFGGPIGVFAGCGMGAYFALNVLRNRKLMEEVGLFLLRHTGNDKDFLATRASYCFDLRGPSVNVQTACSTSLVAIHLASQSLLARECDMALAGGVTIELPHGRGYTFSEGEILSPDGKCRAFDHRARGTIFGSGAGVVVLRRLEDALADKDHIYAVIKGSAVNNDGARKVGYLAPSVDGQAAAIAEALALAGVEPQDVGYVECHGTGTEIGDPIEVSALTQAFAGGPRKQWCGIGSVKTNIGHLDTAAGVASFIKACLALRHGQLPPTLHYEAPNPLIDFANSPFYVNATLRPWPRGPKPRYAGVTSLGVGGTNAHVVVGEAPAPVAAAARPAAGPFVLAWSARNGRSLDEYARKLATWLREHPDADLRDVAGTLAHGRAALPRRRLLVAADRDEAIRLLEGEDPRRLHTHAATEGGAKVVFLLPGGGAQHRHMGKGLYATEPVFREHVDRGLQLLQGQLDVDLREVWFGDAMSEAEVAAAFDRPSVQLPAIFLCEHALAKLWEQKGVKPAALIGHSLGENAAACLAGVMSFADCLRLVTLRGKLFERVRGGGMLSVPLSADECRRRLSADLDLATVNAPGLCVVSGPDAALDAFAARLRQEDLESQRVRIAIAAHSRLLEPILADFGAFLRGIELRKPTIPFLSNRTGTWITDAQATDPEYWVAHLRNTVRFAEGVDALMRDGKHVFLEVGPGRALSSLVRQHPAWSAERSAIATMRHPEEAIADAAHFHGARARLWAAGVDAPLADVVPTDFQRLSLPTYAFRRQRYWVDPDPEGAAPEAASERVDDLSKWRWTPTWRRADLPAEAAPAAGSWLVFCDPAGVGRRAAALLRARGLDVVEAHVGDAYGKIGPGKYAIAPELGRDGYDALLRDLAAQGKALRGALHCWLATVDRSVRPGSSFFHRCEEQGFYSLLFLAQALGAEEPAAPFRLVVLANGLGGPGEAASSPEKALAAGPCLVVPRELPHVRCALVDVTMPEKGRGKAVAATLDAAAAAGVAELAAEDDGRFAWRDGARWRREHEPKELPPTQPGLPPRLRERGCYLVTGGLGGVGSLVGEWLARACKARLVLVGRRELPSRERWDAHVAAHGADDATSRLIQKARALESAGAEVFVGAADVADVAQMRAVVAAARKRFGPIHGVFHAAGVLDDALIAGKEQASVERVLAPKVQGALVLEGCLGAEPLDFTVLFSSTSATLGPPGQVDYVAANAFLDAHAQRRSAAGEPTVAVQWGAWNRVGMTAVDAVDVALGGRPQAVALPLFHELMQVGPTERVLVSRLSPASHWLLDEHRTKDGRAVVPGTGYLEMAAEALEAIGERGPFEARDVWFFRPLQVADGASCEVRVRLRATIEGYEFAVLGETALADGQRGWQTHVEARLLLRAMAAPKPIDLAAVRAGCRDVRAARHDGSIASPQEAHLRFGPRWRVVRELRYGQGIAVAGIALAAEFAAEAERFRLHPAALDLATSCAMELVPGYDPSRLHVPLAYRSVCVHAPLPARYVSVATRVQALGTGGDIVVLDLSLCDEAGRVLVEVEGFQMKRLAAEQRFGVTPPAAREHVAARGASAASQLLAANIEKGILPSEGMEALARVLAGDLQPEQLVSPVPLRGLFADLAKAQAPATGVGRFARPEIDNEYVAPRDEVESALVRFVEELLGIDSVGVQDDFFALGGHSLVAVRLFARIKKQFRVDYPLSVLFEAPTVERLAAMLKRDGVAGDAAETATAAEVAPRHRYRHLVAMHPSKHGEGRPFFLVAGMFGNVLNLRHLAQLCGGERPFYGLQARGLFGDSAPHATFEEAARDYVAELRLVQPHGPYLLGGFSGGGITAFEMCRQLRAAGEQIELLVLLDTPLPTKGVVGRADRLRIQWQRLRRQGPAYLWQWLRNRVAWEVGKLRRRFGGGDDAPESTATFHSQAIEAAFREALGCYRVEPLPVRTWLFRPALDRTYDLGGGRFANKDRELVLPDNGWTAYLGDLAVVETPGDHDSMVLEPNVRSMAAQLREALASAAGRGGATAP